MAKVAKGDEDTKATRPARKTSVPKARDRAKGDLHDRIGRRAYELWEAEGRPQGRDADHWAQAERDISRADGATRGRASRGGAPSAPAVGPGRQSRPGTAKKM